MLSDQGTGVRNLTGAFLDSGNLSITIHDDSLAGNLIFNSTVQNAKHIVIVSSHILDSPIIQ